MLKRIVAVACLLLASVPALRSQVVIREKMVINPKPEALRPQELPSLDNLFAVNGAQIRTTAPGVTVNASLELNVTGVPTGTSVEIVVTAGSTSQVVRRLAKSCEGSITDESMPFPETRLTGCGPISATMKVFDRSAATTYCSSTFKTGTPTASAGGSQATITLQTSLNNYDVVPPQAMNVTATVTISGVPDPSYLQEGIHATPATSQLLCDGQTIIDVVPYDGNGNIYVGLWRSADGNRQAEGQGTVRLSALRVSAGLGHHLPGECRPGTDLSGL